MAVSIIGFVKIELRRKLFSKVLLLERVGKQSLQYWRSFFFCQVKKAMADYGAKEATDSVLGRSFSLILIPE
jgi:hypothetical protein